MVFHRQMVAKRPENGNSKGKQKLKAPPIPDEQSIGQSLNSSDHFFIAVPQDTASIRATKETAYDGETCGSSVSSVTMQSEDSERYYRRHRRTSRKAKDMSTRSSSAAATSLYEDTCCVMTENPDTPQHEEDSDWAVCWCGGRDFQNDDDRSLQTWEDSRVARTKATLGARTEVALADEIQEDDKYLTEEDGAEKTVAREKTSSRREARQDEEHRQNSTEAPAAWSSAFGRKRNIFAFLKRGRSIKKKVSDDNISEAFNPQARSTTPIFY